MKKSIILASVALMSIGLVSCGTTTTTLVAATTTSTSAATSTAISTATSTAAVNKNGVAYGVIDGNCVAKVAVVVAPDKKVTSVSINETFMMASWADINALEVDNQIPTVFTMSTTAWGTTTTHNYAKYIKVGDEVFTGTKRADGDAIINDGEPIIYSSASITDLFTYVSASSANAGWYWDQIFNNTFSVVSNAAGAAYATPYTFGSITSYKTMFKADADNIYWPTTAVVTGWKGNIAKIEAGLVGLDLTTAPVVTKTSDTANGFIGTVNTGATITSFDSYVTLAVAAYAAAK